MAGDELAGQLAVLEEALKRLQGELSRDAAWVALNGRADLADDARAELTRTLEANPVYLAWRNMRDAAAMLKARADTAAAPIVPSPAEPPSAMTMTLADALAQIPQEDRDAEPLPKDVAALLAAQVAAQLGAPKRAPVATETGPQTAEEREQFDVGTRATQMVERILAIPVVEPISPRKPALAPAAIEPAASAAPPAPVEPQPALPAEPARAAEVDPPVPPDAEDLAFLLKPATRVTPEGQSPFLKRLVAEAQALPTKATVLPAPDPFMVPAAEPPAPAVDAQPAQPADDGAKTDETKPRLARLLKSWSRH